MYSLSFLTAENLKIDNFENLSNEIGGIVNSKLTRDEKVLALGRLIFSHMEDRKNEEIPENEQLKMGKWVFRNLSVESEISDGSESLDDEEDFLDVEDHGEFHLLKEGEDVGIFDTGDGRFWKITCKQDGFYTFTYTPPKDPLGLLKLFPAVEPEPEQMVKGGYEQIFDSLKFLGFEFVIQKPQKGSSDTETRSIYELRVPSPHQLLALWNSYKEKQDLPDLEIVISKIGTESDIAFVKIYREHKLVISTKEELFHDYFYHLIPMLLQMIKLRRKNYYQMRKMHVEFFNPFFRKLERMRDPKLSASQKAEFERRYPGVDRYLDMLIKAVGAFVDAVSTKRDEEYVRKTFLEKGLGISGALKGLLNLDVWKKYFLAQMLNEGVIKHASEFEQAVQEMKTLIDLIDHST